MKKWAVVTLLIVLAGGYAESRQTQESHSSPLPALTGLGAPAGGRGEAPPKAINGEGLYWSIDDLRKAYGSPSTSIVQAHLAWTPEYRLTVVKRPYADAATAPSEMHEDKTQMYTVISGTGVQILGGHPAKDNVSAEGQHSSTGPLEGGTSYRVKPGDIVLIPPMTWHQTLPDQGQTVTYAMMHVETRTRLP